MKALFFHDLRSRKKLASRGSGCPSANQRPDGILWLAIGGKSFVHQDDPLEDEPPSRASRWAANAVISQPIWTQVRAQNYRVCCRPHSFVDAIADALAGVKASPGEWEQSHTALRDRIRTADRLAPIEAVLYQPLYSRLASSAHKLTTEDSGITWPLLTRAVGKYISQTPFSLSIGQTWSSHPRLAGRSPVLQDKAVASHSWLPTAGLLLAAWSDLTDCLNEALRDTSGKPSDLWCDTIGKLYPIRHIAIHAPIGLSQPETNNCPTFQSTLFRLQGARALWTENAEAPLALEPYLLHLNSHSQLLLNQIAYGGRIPVLGSLHENESVAAAAATLLLVNYVDRARLILPTRFRAMLLPLIDASDSRCTLPSWAHLNVGRTRDFLKDPAFLMSQFDEYQGNGVICKTPLRTTSNHQECRPLQAIRPSTAHTRKDRTTTANRRSPARTKSANRPATLIGPATAPLSSMHSSLHCSIDADDEVVVSPGQSLFLLAETTDIYAGEATVVRMRMDDSGAHAESGSGVFSYALCTRETLQVRRHILGVTMRSNGTSPCGGIAFDFCTGTMYKVAWGKWADTSSYVVCGLDTPLIQRRNMPATYSLSCNLTEVIVSAQHKIRARTTLAELEVPKAIRFFVILELIGISKASLTVQKYQSPPEGYQMHAHLMDTPWTGNPGKILFSEAFHCRKVGGREAEAFSNCIPHVESLNGAIAPGSIVTIKTEAADDGEPQRKDDMGCTPKPMRSDHKLVSNPSTPPVSASSHPKTRTDRIEVAQKIWSSLLDNPGMPICPWCQVPAFGNRYYHPRSENDNKSLSASVNRRTSSQTSQTSSKTLRAVNAAVLKMESGALGRLQKFRQSETGLRGRT